MMEQPERSTQKISKFFLLFAGLCLIAAVWIILWAFSGQAVTPKEIPPENDIGNFDHSSAAVFESYDALWPEYLGSSSSERTLEEYYSRRQYAGAPPVIPHASDESRDQETPCLSCHDKGGWAEEIKRTSPRTPHPLQANCRQCHTRPEADALFRANEWQSTPPPRLGQSYLPGAPPLVPHSLQMREDCIACHVGPGAIGVIRVDHVARGNCRQCHVPNESTELFQRQS